MCGVDRAGIFAVDVKTLDVNVIYVQNCDVVLLVKRNGLDVVVLHEN